MTDCLTGEISRDVDVLFHDKTLARERASVAFRNIERHADGAEGVLH
jgi:hypothetical protein